MKDIILATDGSVYSVEAARFVHEGNLLPEGGKVHVVHVSAPLSSRVAGFVGKQIIDDWHADESAKAIEPVAEVLSAAGVPYETHAVVGQAANEIVNLAERLNAKMIVMGAHGRGAFLDAVVGSVAGRVVSLSKCPVLLVTSKGKDK